MKTLLFSELKVCTKCRVEKPYTDFYKLNGHSDEKRTRSICKVCSYQLYQADASYHIEYHKRRKLNQSTKGIKIYRTKKTIDYHKISNLLNQIKLNGIDGVMALRIVDCYEDADGRECVGEPFKQLKKMIERLENIYENRRYNEH